MMTKGRLKSKVSEGSGKASRKVTPTLNSTSPSPQWSQSRTEEPLPSALPHTTHLKSRMGSKILHKMTSDVIEGERVGVGLWALPLTISKTVANWSFPFTNCYWGPTTRHWVLSYILFEWINDLFEASGSSPLRCDFWFPNNWWWVQASRCLLSFASRRHRTFAHIMKALQWTMRPAYQGNPLYTGKCRY